jgi:opacity protein-like surface antigen
MRLRIVIAGFFLTAALPALSQVVPSAIQGGFPLTVGAGYTEFYSDWSGNISGGALWADWTFYRVPRMLQGLGIEMEARDLNYNRNGDEPKLRMDTIGGGPIYHYRRFHRVQPYAKFLLGYGSHDFNNPFTPTYEHDTRTVLVNGGGVDYRIWRNVSVRGDYQYQFWLNYFHHHDLNPQGGTVGISYDFGHMHSQ